MDKPTKTSMDGRVTYQDVDYSWLSSEDMRQAGEKVAAAFPGWTVMVTGGPYRSYDAAYKVNRKAHIVTLDFYSARPGLDRVEEMIASMHTRLLLDDGTGEDEWIL